MPGWPLIGCCCCPSSPPTVTSPREPRSSLPPWRPPRWRCRGSKPRSNWLPFAVNHAWRGPPFLSSSCHWCFSLRAPPTRAVIGCGRRGSAGCKTKRRGGRAPATCARPPPPLMAAVPPPFPSRPPPSLLPHGPARTGVPQPPPSPDRHLPPPPEPRCPLTVLPFNRTTELRTSLKRGKTKIKLVGLSEAGLIMRNKVKCWNSVK